MATPAGRGSGDDSDDGGGDADQSHRHRPAAARPTKHDARRSSRRAAARRPGDAREGVRNRSVTLRAACADVIIRKCNNMRLPSVCASRIMYNTYYIIFRIILYYVLSFPGKDTCSLLGFWRANPNEIE